VLPSSKQIIFKTEFFNVLLAALMVVLMKPKCTCCNNKNQGNAELMLVILNYTLLHNQNGSWALL